ncbi:MAG TPA: hypothetical protein ENK70_03660, partial [Methylophaga sp.]|nr:hypothetical protein [Methylophaga sp.]
MFKLPKYSSVALTPESGKVLIYINSNGEIVIRDENGDDHVVIGDVSQFIKRDGTNPPIVDIDWGGFRLTNLGDPIDISDAVTVRYLAKAASAIGSRYYMLATDSGIDDYKLCSIIPSAESEQSVSVTDITDGQYLAGWISPNPGEP